MWYTVFAFVRPRGAIGIFTQQEFCLRIQPDETVKERWFLLFTDAFELHHFERIVEE